MKKTNLFIIILLFSSCSIELFRNNTEIEKEDSVDIAHFTSIESEKLGFPFSDATIVDNIIYVSGQVGNFPGTTELISGGIGPETTQALNNIKSILNQIGSSADNIFKCLCMLSDIDDYSSSSTSLRRAKWSATRSDRSAAKLHPWIRHCSFIGSVFVL